MTCAMQAERQAKRVEKTAVLYSIRMHRSSKQLHRCFLTAQQCRSRRTHLRLRHVLRWVWRVIDFGFCAVDEKLTVSARAEKFEHVLNQAGQPSHKPAHRTQCSIDRARAPRLRRCSNRNVDMFRRSVVAQGCGQRQVGGHFDCLPLVEAC